MNTNEAKKYIRSMVYQARVWRDGIAFVARYGKGKQTAKRLQEAVSALGGNIWEYNEFYTSRSRYDNERVYCDVTFDVGNDDNWLVESIENEEKKEL